MSPRSFCLRCARARVPSLQLGRLRVLPDSVACGRDAARAARVTESVAVLAQAQGCRRCTGCGGWMPLDGWVGQMVAELRDRDLDWWWWWWGRECLRRTECGEGDLVGRHVRNAHVCRCGAVPGVRPVSALRRPKDGNAGVWDLLVKLCVGELLVTHSSQQ
jgi:hypothetical protein